MERKTRKRCLPNGIQAGSVEDNTTKKQKIYLDYNATTPLEPSVLDAIYSTLKFAWGNPSSSNSQGKIAKRIVDESRCHVAEMLSRNSSEIVFTSGGTEANNMVFLSVVEEANQQQSTRKKCDGVLVNGERKWPHVVTSVIEHDSVIMALRQLEEKEVITLTVVPVSKDTGHVEIDAILSAIQTETILVTIMLANNETGVIQVFENFSKFSYFLNPAFVS